MSQIIRIPASLEAVSHMTSQLEQQFDVFALDIRVMLTLAIQELCVNIVRHAYAGASGDIELQIEQTPATIVFHVTDTAPNAFDVPEHIPEPNPLDLPESGMGLFIIHQTFDKVVYKRLAHGNEWQLVKSLKE